MSDSAKPAKSKLSEFGEAVKWIAEICCDLEDLDEFDVRVREGVRIFEVRLYWGEQRAAQAFTRESLELRDKAYMRRTLERLAAMRPKP